MQFALLGVFLILIVVLQQLLGQPLGWHSRTLAIVPRVDLGSIRFSRSQAWRTHARGKLKVPGQAGLGRNTGAVAAFTLINNNIIYSSIKLKVCLICILRVFKSSVNRLCTPGCARRHCSTVTPRYLLAEFDARAVSSHWPATLCTVYA